MTTPGTVAILSPGEMGHAIRRVLARRGLRVITSLDGRSERTAERASSAGIEDVGSLDRVVDEADTILSLLPSAAAPVVASAGTCSPLHLRWRGARGEANRPHVPTLNTCFFPSTTVSR
jgi:ornithine cyclodeaminase/alanine dehydrogenase-like protein (mu-crystallin family)